MHPDLTTLSRYLDGVCPPEESQEVAAHLPGCQVCQAEYADLLLASSAVQALAPALPSPYLPLPSGESVRGSWWPLPALAFAGLLLLVGGSLQHPLLPDGEKPRRGDLQVARILRLSFLGNPREAAAVLAAIPRWETAASFSLAPSGGEGGGEGYLVARCPDPRLLNAIRDALLSRPVPSATLARAE